MRFPILVLSFVLGTLVFTSCGPSAEEKAAKEKATQDSIDAAMAADMEKELSAATEVHDSLKASADSSSAEHTEHAEGDHKH